MASDPSGLLQRKPWPKTQPNAPVSVARLIVWMLVATVAVRSVHASPTVALGERPALFMARFQGGTSQHDCMGNAVDSQHFQTQALKQLLSFIDL